MSACAVKQGSHTKCTQRGRFTVLLRATPDDGVVLVWQHEADGHDTQVVSQPDWRPARTQGHRVTHASVADVIGGVGREKRAPNPAVGTRQGGSAGWTVHGVRALSYPHSGTHVMLAKKPCLAILTHGTLVVCVSRGTALKKCVTCATRESEGRADSRLMYKVGGAYCCIFNRRGVCCVLLDRQTRSDECNAGQ